MTSMTARSEHDSLRPAAQPAAPLVRHFRGSGATLGYLLLASPLALVAFIGAVTLFSLGVGTLIIWVGVPILVGAGLYARGSRWWSAGSSHTDEGLRAAIRVRKACPKAPILVLSQYVVLSYAEELLAAGGRLSVIS
jgi:hypothetical protein